jgi:2-(1,2-epoxy-1,2-dihydrophenyl)acetyl-CoA isomerase
MSETHAFEAEPVITSVTESGVATITLNRPDKLNSFNRRMAEELLSALLAAVNDGEVRAIGIAASGKAFCAGQDLSEVLPGPDGEPRDLGAIVREFYNPIISAIASAPIPVVAIVNGVAAGAGANLALACDFVIAAESASFVQAFSKVGLIPDSGGTFFLPRLIGLAQAKRLTLLGEKISSKEMLELGAIYKVVSDAELKTASAALLSLLASSATAALGETKLLLNRTGDSTLADQLQAEEAAQRRCGFSADYAEGVAAFVSRRAPSFSGR